MSTGILIFFRRGDRVGTEIVTDTLTITVTDVVTVTMTVTYNWLMDRFSVFAPAKVNLHLAVKNKRPDGFHNLESVFLAVNFGDDLSFSSVPNNSVSGGSSSVPNGGDCFSMEFENAAEVSSSVPAENVCSIPNNIILRALSLFREKTGFKQNLSINVVKRIPIGGGLGGGSSDAAATLLALNKIAGSPLGTELLLEMGAVLGSDVPFFLRQIPAAMVTGRGECIEPIEAPQMFLVLVNPGFPSDTGTAFKLLDENRRSQESHSEDCLTTRERSGARRRVTVREPFFIQNNFNFKLCNLDNHEIYKKTSNGNSASANCSPTRFCESSFYNDFLPVFDDRVKTIYYRIISMLTELGAQYANLSGSGSTCFGVFENEERAQKAAEVLQNDWSFVRMTSTL